MVLQYQCSEFERIFKLSGRTENHFYKDNFLRLACNEQSEIFQDEYIFTTQIAKAGKVL